ncbi:vWA domain-containing protein [Syntrophorhabdus aromaticivorans]|uniref:VWA domain-containing protein n=1 Tax=Syntrophorhabdus aromaticivorans TaxID=328301 RepID=A0A971M7N9_9BACT|nr:VWA domain-containing protein [Syntrophorhabdus aromaticivorans]NLW36922.1 VWA domain-containing protein [Syntrophorhabdus aromaticivorans]
MFTDFFYLLRQKGVPVTVTEWVSFIEALHGGYFQSSLNHLYYIGRAFLVKSEAYYDMFDLAFQEYFGGIKTEPLELEKVMDWLENPLNRLPKLSPEEMAEFQKKLEEFRKEHDMEELMRQFRERLKEQKERHDGGAKWIGTGGVSPFGAYGYHPGGIRVGGESWMQSAAKVAGERRFRNYRNDLILDVRQTKMALKKLRELKREGAQEELDIPETIDKTAKEGGEIELVFNRSRENTVRLILLMDTGGSMLPYTELCERLFSAASQMEHFKEFKYYFFHNCIYQDVYEDIGNYKRVPTEKLFAQFHKGYKVVLVGDARMAYSELFDVNGCIDYFYANDKPAIEWLMRIKEHFPHSVWLNPTHSNFWGHYTVDTIGKIFPMFELTIDGLKDAIKALTSKAKPAMVA